MEKPILYSFKRCPYAMRARMIIFLTDIQCELREVHLKNKPQSMLDLSPKGTVPVLQIDAYKVIDESLEIVEWALGINDIFKKNKILPDQEVLTKDLISLFDDEFKFHLDRYKYSVRYQDANPIQSRSKCLEILNKIENSISNSNWFFGDSINKLDICILPFIRQFRIADPEWFDSLNEIHQVKSWLKHFLKSPLLLNIMNKNDPWQEGDQALIFPLSE
jgi:glutathione S-transferase